jgi:hypothetical protein
VFQLKYTVKTSFLRLGVQKAIVFVFSTYCLPGNRLRRKKRRQTDRIYGNSTEDYGRLRHNTAFWLGVIKEVKDG